MRNGTPQPSPAAFGFNPIGQELKAASFTGGVQLGYDYMVAPSWLIGLEGDWSWTDRKAKDSTGWTVAGTTTPVAGAFVEMSRRVEWLSTVRARLGYAVTPQALLYVTGGFAFGQVKYSAASFDAFFYDANFSDRTLKTGWTAGGGLEWALTRHWLLRADYLFYRLGSESGTGISTVFPANPSNFTWKEVDVHTAGLAVNYRF